MSEIKEKVREMLDGADIRATVFFDRCTVAAAKLERGDVMVAAYMDDTTEPFDQQLGLAKCLEQFSEQLMAEEAAAEAPAPVLTEKEAQVIVNMAAEDLKVAKVAEKMHYNKKTIYRYLDEIKEKTGCDPMSFYGMVELLVEAQMVLGEQEA